MERYPLIGSFLMLVLLGTVYGGCYDLTDCYTCTSQTGYFSWPCMWCPLSDTCHTYGSWYSPCRSSFAARNSSTCDLLPPPTTDSYNQTLAVQLASWSSLAYVKPGEIDPEVLRNVLESELPGGYRMLKYLQKYCDILVEYSACSLLVAISDLERNIIVSFEGTQNIDQLFEQLTSAIVTGLESTEIGGKVLYYNYNVHQLLYPCLQKYLRELLANNPGYRLTLTGHSLGGAQAQLAAAALIYDGVTTNEKLEVYSFGAPRFGDADFANHFNNLVRHNWRLVQATDPVPRIPPYFVYHTHEEVWFSEPGITPSSNYTICQVNEDEACALSQSSHTCFSEDCVEVHKNYFLDIGSKYAEGKLAGDSTPSLSTYGTCDSVDFSDN
ncbi:lipase ZK262.3-like [Watersipora subatra]|uniref:lipase ZK262.3-like n=1 Tax=Watersipora subatra TaxID=2589382 RepID=UPI00355C7825